MAYDRYDTRRGHEQPRSSEYERGRRDERGFFERAGDEIASWWGGDDESDRGRHPDDRMSREDRWAGDRDRPRELRGSRDQRDRDPGFKPEYGEQPMRGSRPMERSSGPDRGSAGYRPLTGDYGRSEERSNGPQDRHYHEWRERQLSELDRDYDEYHRERQQHFENDFGSWRSTRQQKRQMLGQVHAHMDVVGSDGESIGKVDRAAGDRIILTKSDAEDGRHHSIPCTMIDKVEGDKLMLDCTAEKAKKQWRDDDRERALFEREDQGEAGPHILDRSFSGTYS